MKVDPIFVCLYIPDYEGFIVRSEIPVWRNIDRKESNLKAKYVLESSALINYKDGSDSG